MADKPKRSNIPLLDLPANRTLRPLFFGNIVSKPDKQKVNSNALAKDVNKVSAEVLRKR